MSISSIQSYINKKNISSSPTITIGTYDPSSYNTNGSPSNMLDGNKTSSSKWNPTTSTQDLYTVTFNFSKTVTITQVIFTLIDDSAHMPKNIKIRANSSSTTNLNSTTSITANSTGSVVTRTISLTNSYTSDSIYIIFDKTGDVYQVWVVEVEFTYA